MSHPVVIVGGGINGLGVARSLKRQFTLHVVDSNQQCPAAHSRFTRFHRVNSTKSEALIDDLLNLRNQFNENPVLLITEEKAVFNVSKYRQKLSSAYRFLMPEHHLVEQLLDKNDFYDLAVEHQAPVPKTLAIDSQEDLKKVSNLSFPCAFKPHEQNAAYSKTFKKAYKVFSAEEVTQLYKEIEPTLSKMILQEWIEGDDSEIFFTLSYIPRLGKPIKSFTGRKIRSWPLNVGGTASCTNAPEVAAELEQISHDFCTRMNYCGLIGIEYKRDKRNGQFLMIEPTVARTDFQHEIATLSGCHLLSAMVIDSYQNDRQHIVIQQDELNQIQKPLRPIVWKESLSEEMAISQSKNGEYPARAIIYSALFRWSDPYPYIAQLIQRVRKRVSRVLGINLN